MLLSLLGFGILSAAPAAAQDAVAQGPAVKGTFVLVPDEGDDISASIEAAVRR